MKRANVNYMFIIEFGDLFLPSKRNHIQDFLWDNNAGTVKEVCQLTEEQFRSFPFATDNTVKRVKERMTEYGLSFGMTPEELNDYEDAEFIMTHPEMKMDELKEEEIKPSNIIDFDFSKYIRISKERDDKNADEIEDCTEQDEQMGSDMASILLDLSPKAQEILNNFSNQQLNQVLEDRIIRTLQDAYKHQPWWKKLFCNSKSRQKSALDEMLFFYCTSIVLKHKATDLQKTMLENRGNTKNIEQ